MQRTISRWERASTNTAKQPDYPDIGQPDAKTANFDAPIPRLRALTLAPSTSSPNTPNTFPAPTRSCRNRSPHRTHVAGDLGRARLVVRGARVRGHFGGTQG